MDIREKKFGNKSTLISISNDNGVILEVTNFGARIVNLHVLVEGDFRNISLGFDKEEEYYKDNIYFGATIGRVAGRISNGTFKINGLEYKSKIDCKTGHTLHGGKDSFESKYWDFKTISNCHEASVIFTYNSHDGENGFPGNLITKVKYTLNNKNECKIRYYAKSDKTTIFNPTNHVYFNLTGDVTKSIGEHKLFVNSDFIAILNNDNTTTGNKKNILDTVFDFKNEKTLSKIFENNDDQIKIDNGLNHPFFLNNKKLDIPDLILTSPDNKLSIEMKTDQPSVVIYTNNIGNSGPYMHGKKLVNHGGIALETQVSPGAEKFEKLGNITLEKDNKYESTTTYKIIINH